MVCGLWSVERGAWSVERGAWSGDQAVVNGKFTLLYTAYTMSPAGSVPARSHTYTRPRCFVPSTSGLGISTSSIMMQCPRVDMGLNCVGAMALRAFACMNT